MIYLRLQAQILSHFLLHRKWKSMNNKKSDKKYSTYAAKTSFVKMKILTTKVKLSLQKNISVNLLWEEEKIGKATDLRNC